MSDSAQLGIAIVLGIAAALSLFVAERIQRRSGHGALLLSLLMAAAAIWLAGFAAEFIAPALQGKVFAARVQYIGITTIPPLWFLFVLFHTSRQRWITRRTVAALFSIPVVTVALAWTSSAHGLLWTSTRLDADAVASGLAVEYGFWFWIHTAYSYSLLIGSNAALIVMFIRALRLYRRQAMLMILGVVVPLVANVAYLFRIGGIRIDPTPLGLAFSGGLLAWALWRWRLLEIKPVARARSVEGMRDGVIVLDHQQRVVDYNPAAVALLRFEEERAVGTPVSEAVPGLPMFDGAINATHAGRMEIPGDVAGRPNLVLETTVSSFGESSGDDRGHWLIVVRDVTERDLAERRLRDAEQRYRTLVEQMPAVTYTRAWSDDFVPTYLSPQIQSLLGYGPDDLCERQTPSWRQLIFHEDLDEVLANHRAATEQQSSFAAEYRLRSESGRVVWVRDEAVVNRDEAGNPRHWQGIIVDVSAQKQLETQLERYAFYDTLTGLPNRALLLDRLRQSLSRVARAGKQVGVLFIDLDGFKIINDTLGHSAGDRVLQEVSRRLKSSLRIGDTAGRLGGDEFVIVVEGIEGNQSVTQIAERITNTIRRPMTSAGQDVVVNCSVGIRLGVREDESPEDLLRDADIAMYWAKRRGRGRTVVFDPTMLANRWNRLGLESELRTAIDADQLEIFYQPIVSLQSGRLTGFEALLRWIHPERGMIMPDEFIQIAEDSGLILAIDRWMLVTACRQVRAWQARMLDGDAPLSVNVNITPRHFQQPSMVADVETALDISGLSANQLILEITESNAMQDVPSVSQRLDDLNERGISIIIDDFGTGYSALAYLRRFAISGIKIDRSFVAGLGTNPDDTSLVTAVVSLARSFNLTVTAEGVETRSQWADLRALGADYGQGHLFALPMPVQEIDRHFASGDLSKLFDYPPAPQLKIVGGE